MELLIFLISILIIFGIYHQKQAQKKRFRPTAANIDPVGEAEVFLFMKKYAEAIYVLKHEIQINPSNLEAKIKLLNIFAECGQTQNYFELAQKNSHELQRHPALWETICQTAQRLNPDVVLLA